MKELNQGYLYLWIGEGNDELGYLLMAKNCGEDSGELSFFKGTKPAGSYALPPGSCVPLGRVKPCSVTVRLDESGDRDNIEAKVLPGGLLRLFGSSTRSVASSFPVQA